jgi:S-methyl-5-thioribose-1-phosphate isomerase
MLVGSRHYRTVWMEKSRVYMIDQTKLPFSFEIYESKNHRDTANAIKTMIVRGAGAIGSAGGFGMAQAFSESRNKDYLKKAKTTLESTRPTAQNLFYAVDSVYKSSDPLKEAQMIADEDVAACEKIGEFGSKLIKDNMRIETHCNAGWLAFTDWGTALSPIYAAKRAGKKVFVYVDETRPRSQGARLTAWELKNEKIEHAIIPDNAAGYYMQRGEIDIIMVGADRVCASDGSFANKIGTYEKAVLAKENGIPFHVAVPTSTFDFALKSGKDIPIEERDEEEVLYQTGINKNGKIEKILVCNPGSKAKNPSFDVTPAKFVTSFITEKGIIKPSRKEIARLFK